MTRSTLMVNGPMRGQVVEFADSNLLVAEQMPPIERDPHAPIEWNLQKPCRHTQKVAVRLLMTGEHVADLCPDCGRDFPLLPAEPPVRYVPPPSYHGRKQLKPGDVYVDWDIRRWRLHITVLLWIISLFFTLLALGVL